MKPWGKFILVLLCLPCLAFVVEQANNIYIRNSVDEVKIKIVSSGQTLPWIDIGTQTNSIFQLPASGLIPTTYGGTGTNSVAGAKSVLGIVTFSVISTNAYLITNTFSPVFSSTPTVTVSSTSNVLAHVVSVNPTNVVIGVAGTNSTVNAIAIGAP